MGTLSSAGSVGKFLSTQVNNRKAHHRSFKAEGLRASCAGPGQGPWCSTERSSIRVAGPSSTMTSQGTQTPSAHREGGLSLELSLRESLCYRVRKDEDITSFSSVI